MELLLSHISYLLGEHRQVPVVGLGTFTRVERPAAFEQNGISAPGVHIEFAAEVDPHAPRIVEASVARGLCLPLAEASALIDDQVAAITRALFSGEAVDIDGVGTLSYSGKSIEFEESQPAGWSALGWYGHVDATPLVAEEEPVAEVSPSTREAFMRSLSRTASSAAAVAILILITFITSQLPGRRGGGEPLNATFGVETTAIAPSDALIPRPGTSAPTVLYLVTNTPADAVIEVTPEPEPLMVADDPYVLVVASLANDGEVERFMAAHPDEQLGLLRSQGRLRVFAATGSSVSSLQADATEAGLYNRYPNAWICRR